MDWETVSDADLSRQCRQGRKDAWRQLIRRCAPTAYRVAVHMVGPADAEDACQEVFLKMYRAFDTYDPTRPLKPWVARIAYHVCLRRREGVIAGATMVVAPQEVNDTFDADQNPEHEAAQRQTNDHLLKAMAVLTADDRALLTLRYREGLSDAEVADAADMPINTVKTRIFRARGRLKKALQAMLRGETP